MTQRNFDIIIVGAGMVGASFADALIASDTDLDIGLVESLPLGRSSLQIPSYDARSTVLSRGTALHYQTLGLWSDLEPHCAPIRSIDVSDQGHPVFTRLLCEDIGAPALGYVIENRLLGQQLLAPLRECPRISVFAPATVLSLERHAHATQVVIQLESGECEQLGCQLLVAADGTHSSLRKQLGITEHTESYGSAAIVANVSIESAQPDMAFERFTLHGPVALLPLPTEEPGSQRFALVMTQPENDAQAVLELEDDEFLSLLQREFENRVGRFIRIGQRNVYPLNRTRSREQVRTGVVLLGNAAHTLHPVAGQGFNLALRDLICLAELLVEARQGNCPLGDLGLLERYVAQRQFDQNRTDLGTHALVQLFTSDSTVPAFSRQLGLFALSKLAAARRAFISVAAGLELQ